MIYSGSATKQDIVSDTLFEASANLTSYPIADITRNSNTALDNVVTIRLGADPKWDFDSTNATDFPIGSTDILSGQQDYEFDDNFLIIKSIEIQDSTGKWTKLQPIDQLTLPEQQALSDFETTAGTPKYYDKVGNSIFLFPIPNYNRRLVEEGEAGLKVYFQRNVDYFTTTDTTKQPGFALHLHKYIPLYNAYVYACAKELPKQNSLAKRLEFYEGNKMRGGNNAGAIYEFYSRRELDVRRKLTAKIENNK